MGFCVFFDFSQILFSIGPDSPHFPLLTHSTGVSLLVEIGRVVLGWGTQIRVFGKELLNSQEQLLHLDGWFPVFFFVQNAQANCPRWVDVRMGEDVISIALFKLA